MLCSRQDDKFAVAIEQIYTLGDIFNLLVLPIHSIIHFLFSFEDHFSDDHIKKIQIQYIVGYSKAIPHQWITMLDALGHKHKPMIHDSAHEKTDYKHPT